MTKRNLTKTLLPVSHIFRVMGLYPVDLKTSQITWNAKIYVVNFTIITIFTIWGVWGFANDMTTASFLTLGFRGAMDFFTTSFHVAVMFLNSFYFVASTPCKFGQMETVLKKLGKIDILHPPTDKFVTKTRKKFLLFVTNILAFLVVVYVLDLYMWGNNSWWGINNYMGFYTVYTVGVMQEVQFYQFMTLLKIRVEALNDYIERAVAAGETNHKQVVKMTRMYDSLCDAADAINVAFGSTITVGIFGEYTSLVVSPYVLFVMMTSNDTSFWNFVYFLWIGLCFFRLWLVLNPCHLCVERSKKSLTLVFRLICLQSHGNITAELRVLILSMIRRKITFSGYALPNVNRHFLISVFRSISAYWMIIIQYSTRLD